MGGPPLAFIPLSPTSQASHKKTARHSRLLCRADVVRADSQLMLRHLADSDKTQPTHVLTHRSSLPTLLAACRRERMGSDASRSASACVVHSTGTRARTACGRRQDRISDGDRTTWKD